MMIVALDLVLQVLVQDLLLKGLLKVMTSLEDVTRSYVQDLISKNVFILKEKRLDSF